MRAGEMPGSGGGGGFQSCWAAHCSSSWGCQSGGCLLGRRPRLPLVCGLQGFNRAGCGREGREASMRRRGPFEPCRDGGGGCGVLATGVRSVCKGQWQSAEGHGWRELQLLCCDCK